MSRKQPDLPETPEGHRERLRRAVKRCQIVLNSSVAQREDAPKLGTTFNVNLRVSRIDPMDRTVNLSFPLPDQELLETAVTRVRVFVLRREVLYWEKVLNSLLTFTSDEYQIKGIEQIKRMWADSPFTYSFALAGNKDGEDLLPDGGVSNAVIADRYLYSKIAHSDDASEILDHVLEPMQLMALAAMVGDWLAITSHMEHWINAVCPDICPEVTEWGGGYATIFERIGITPNK